MTVWVVVCIARDERDVMHMFSTQEKAAAFCESDPRAHVVYDYVLDCPQRLEQRVQ